jgi:putative ABC transport system ATP-binding protein
MASFILEMRQVAKSFGAPGESVRTVLRGVDLAVPAGRTLAVIGRSGTGKSTLLHLAAGIDLPTSGEVRVEGRDLAQWSERERTLFRRSGVGLVFQFFHLLPHLSVEENVALPEMIAGGDEKSWGPRAASLLARVGLADRAREPVRKLSGGEMQRVALCRALLRRPKLLLADEPTGNLDEATGVQVADILFELSREDGTTLVLVTHSAELADRADEVHQLHDGRLERLR